MLRQIYRCAGLALVVAALAGCGSDEKSSAPSQFSYDDSKPLDVQDKPTSFSTNDVRVDDISFSGPGDTPLNAYLLTPSGSKGRHPAVIYAHGAGGDRQELLDEALKMADKGAVTLTLDMIYSPSRAKPLPEGMEGARANSKLEQEAVKEVRRAVDLLQSRDDVDDDQIGYVGWSAGARMGALISGVEHRIKAFDLLAGGAAPVSAYVSHAPVDLQDELTTLLEKTDPIHFVGPREAVRAAVPGRTGGRSRPRACAQGARASGQRAEGAPLVRRGSRAEREDVGRFAKLARRIIST